MTQALTILIIAAVIILLAKGFQPHAILILAGLLLLTLSIIAGKTTILPEGAASTGWIGFDIFKFISQIMKGRVGEIGLIIMSAGGLAKYMTHIGAANALVQISIQPLKKLRNPYLILAFVSVLGQIMKIGIPSAAGLAMLLLITVYPTLLHIGITPASAAAVIAGTTCLDVGPASATSVVAAELAGMDAVVYFIKFQLPAMLAPVILIAILNIFVQHFFDRREAAPVTPLEAGQAEPRVEAPRSFAILPLIPLILLLIFNQMVVGSIVLNVVTAMFISLLVGMVFNAVHTRDLRTTLADIMVYFRGMGEIFATVVTLIFAAETFAGGLRAVGFIDMILGVTTHSEGAASLLIIMLVIIIGVTAILTGSGNAAFFSFSNLAPSLAASVGKPTLSFVFPMQLTSGLFRTISPVAGVILAVSGTAGVDPFTIVKRTAIPAIAGIIAVIIFNWLFY
ncbi:MAG: C4-dicarboxylate transporter DcuC [Candidatus Marinimicrobia bacterium]|nr:C4-dicarboxylate transporter DcuC [Candidatus Neomarinimicrobiota bacterium]